MTIARYRELVGHPVWKYSVELIVLSNGKRVKIAEFNCKNDEELAFATDCCDHVLKGE